MYFLLILAIFVQSNANKAPSRGDLRVYKGRNDTHNEFPFAVVLQRKDPPVFRKCTGILIADNWVLTSADCVFVPRARLPVVPGHMVIRYGDFTKPANETKLYSSVIKIYAHPSYSELLWINDIALILTEKIPGKNFASRLALDYKTFFGLHVKYAGFGQIAETVIANSKDKRESESIPLQIGEGIVVPCEKTVKLLCVLPKCSDRKLQMRPGDSGGPLVYDGRVIGVAAGISSNSPITWFTPISPYLEWIQNTITLNEG
ncbi:mast cell protease 1A-like [Cydia amplana]|uniref:mast cell protease 1A-like n=1 Tax=Cydia amplana TaxID=1869771 RepID=UPI002FE61D1A